MSRLRKLTSSARHKWLGSSRKMGGHLCRALRATKKLERCGTSLYCNRCVSSDVTGLVRFRVELAVDDGKDSATFVVFDKEMTKLTRQEATVLVLEEGPNGSEEYIPNCLQEIAGKHFVFQIRVTSFNFTHITGRLLSRQSLKMTHWSCVARNTKLASSQVLKVEQAWMLRLLVRPLL